MHATCARSLSSDRGLRRASLTAALESCTDDMSIVLVSAATASLLYA